MTLKALLYAYVLGGLTFLPLLVAAVVFVSIYTSVPVGDPDLSKRRKAKLEGEGPTEGTDPDETRDIQDVNDSPRTRKGWLTMRRTFEESKDEGSYVNLVRSFIDARSKDPKRSRPKDMWYCVLKGKVMYLYEDESMTECEAAVEVGGHDVVVFPEGLQDGELFAKRNAIMLKPKTSAGVPSGDVEKELQEVAGRDGSFKKKSKEREEMIESEKVGEEALNPSTTWFIFVRSAVEMEDWYLALLHASDHPANSPMLAPLFPVFHPGDMNHLVGTLDEQPDVIPMRWLNALIGRLFFSFYRTDALEANIIGRLMKKLSKVKRPAFLTDIVVTEVSVGNKPPTFSKPMLKELTKEGDAALEVHMTYKGEFRITIEATATITLGSKYTVKLALAAVVRELEGNLLIKVKRPPSNRMWYAFTAPPKMVLVVEPIVSDRQITWTMILSTIESKMKEIILESVVMPNMDDISFFETGEFEHRGGIWADAARKVKVPSEALEGGGEAPSEDAGVPIGRAQTMETGPTSTAEELGGVSITRAATTEARLTTSDVESSIENTSGSAASTPMKRRTWFSSIRDDDSRSGTPQSSITSMFEEQRGRTTETESAFSLRSRSTPNQGEAVARSDTMETIESAMLSTPAFLSPGSSVDSHTTPPRSSRSPSRGKSPSPEPETSSFSSLNRTPSRASSKGTHSKSNSQTSNVPISPTTGFLDTLKSRAGDKQAISNSAKEAMRKWGVNWGGSKKDAPTSNNTTTLSDDLPDQGSVESRTRVDSLGTSPNSQKARASYAEVRAAVAERKEREKGGDSVGSGSAPVPIPTQSRRSSYTTQIGSSSVSASPGASSSSGSAARRPSSATDIGPSPSRHVAPAMSRTTTEMSSGSERGHLPSEATSSPPLKTQPMHTNQPSQARTMMIPGIHASHRGEVMSMGYVAPPPPPPPPTESILKTPTMNLNSPALQSVYRLWKSPGASQKELPDVNSNNPIAAEPTVSQAPPPLPPRVAPPMEHIPETPARPTSPPTAASEALKSIVNRDLNKRASMDGGSLGVSLNPGPPLPPRPSGP